LHSGWLTAGLPCSAAETVGAPPRDDRSQRLQSEDGGQRPGCLAEMQATAAWQAVWGVTDYTLYYGMRGPVAGRLSSVLRVRRPAECAAETGPPGIGRAAVLSDSRSVERIRAGCRAAEAGVPVSTAPTAGAVVSQAGPVPAAQPGSVHHRGPRAVGSCQGASGWNLAAGRSDVCRVDPAAVGGVARRFGRHVVGHGRQGRPGVPRRWAQPRGNARP